MLKVSYYGYDRVRHISNKKTIERDKFVEAICGKLAIFTRDKSYRLVYCLEDDFYPKWKVICTNCVNKLSKKTQEYIIHKLIVKKLKG